ncbi:oligosaccharide flippase family protein [Vibrio parahaemolyticus]|nr:oligosaccharide flippase family protein [Vibrio parahaemolyticus]EIZ1328124.1 oligosaccharide flippase family protein [Vibrio parahaemolyticus]EJB5623034.1 oligosaccharide flippase family protein [Vibrio parahaemolyticus]EJC6730400.1 oligosaccharide flippase family protein [Vibrio parahaemolyticus]EJC6943598.1 oligosaccharide flippase family protein [Vibrio parahaemolyticus]
MNKSIKSKVLNGVLWGSSEKFIAQLVNFSLMLYLSYRLTPSDFALIGLVNIFIIFADTLSTTGVSSFLIHKGNDSKNNYFPPAFFLSLTTSGFIVLVILLCNSLIASYFGDESLLTIIPFMLTSVILNSVSSVYRSEILIKLGFSFVSKVAILSNVFSAIIGFLLAYYGVGYWALASLPVIRSVIVFICFSTSSELQFKIDTNIEKIKEIYSFGYKVLLSGVIVIISNGLVVLVGSRVLNSEEVGLYSLALSYVTFFSSTIGLLIQKITYPLLSNLKKEKNLYDFSLEKVIFFTSLISLPCMVGIAAISEDFVYVFLDDKWKAMFSIMIFLSFSKAFWPITAVNTNIYNSLGFPSLTLYNDLFKLILTFFVVLLFIDSGLFKVSLWQFLISILFFLFSAFLSGKVSRFGIKRQLKIILPSVISSVVMFLVVFCIDLDNMYVQLFSKIIVGGFLYSILMFFPVRRVMRQGYKDDCFI